jgi:CBS domain-containing protein
MRSACQESVVRGESRGMSRRKTTSGRSSACGLAVMTRGADAMAFTPEERASQAAKAFERYDLVSAPVVDGRGKLVGA